MIQHLVDHRMAKKRAAADDTTRLLSALCYPLWPVALVLLLLDKREGDLRFHSLNGLGFGIVLILLWVIWSFFGWFIPGFWFLSWILEILWLVFAIVYAIKAYEGGKPQIPVVTELVRKHV
jgi:uncharacterized membrane protein